VLTPRRPIPDAGHASLRDGGTSIVFNHHKLREVRDPSPTRITLSGATVVGEALPPPPQRACIE